MGLMAVPQLEAHSLTHTLLRDLQALSEIVSADMSSESILHAREVRDDLVLSIEAKQLVVDAFLALLCQVVVLPAPFIPSSQESENPFNDSSSKAPVDHCW